MNTGPKWQRARNLGEFRGLLFWVRTGPPEWLGPHAATDPTTGIEYVTHASRLTTNMVHEGLPCFANTKSTELLPEFADDVPLIDVNAAIESWRAASAAEVAS